MFLTTLLCLFFGLGISKILNVLLKQTLPPDFRLLDQNKMEHSLDQYTGRWVLLFFYPKDDTPGCTIESCGIRDKYSDFLKAGIAVLGVSADDAMSHKNFADKYSLPFTLLSDPDLKVIKEYGAWGERTRSTGEKVMSILRISYLIGPDGKIAKAYAHVKPEQHAEEILRDHAELTN